MAAKVEQVSAQIKRGGIIAVLRGDFPVEQVLRVAATLVEAGLWIVEVTLNSSDALAAIAALRRHFDEGSLLVGAGTVRTADQVTAAIAAGAQFSVAPNFDPAAVARAQAAGSLHIPGVFTPTEAQRAFAAGCRLLKLFPADALGPAYLKALRAPLNDVEFVPTGGVSAENLAAYVRAGAVAVGVGGALVAGPQQPLAELAGRARALRAAWQAATEIPP